MLMWSFCAFPPHSYPFSGMEDIFVPPSDFFYVHTAASPVYGAAHTQGTVCLHTHAAVGVYLFYAFGGGAIYF